MKKTTGILLAVLLAAFCAVFQACTAENTDPGGAAETVREDVIAEKTPAPKTLSVTERTDAGTLRALIAASPSLESVAIAPGALENAEIAELTEAFPEIGFQYEVAVGSRYVAPDVTELSAEGCTAEEIAAALPYLRELKTVHLGACDPEALAAVFPLFPEGMADYSVLIFGRELAPDAETLDLSEAASPAPETLKAALPYLPALTAVELGSREDPALAAAFRAAVPELTVNCRYTFTWMDRELSESTETLDLTNVRITDVDELRRVLSWLPALRHTEMVGCGLDNETMAALRDEFPEKGIVWEISLGYWGRLRTDATAFTTRSSKSPDEMKYRLTTETLQPIRYCTELVALDLGHQKIDDISCLQGLHKLQILILADNRISDITALASMPDLVYVELFYNHVSDLSPLSGLTKLKDLNVCSNEISDLTPLYGLTSLERLWYSNNRFTAEDHEALQKQLPNCICNRTVWDETADGWREHERYFWMRSFFKDSPRYK
jgi:Leucine-rich repeat (LRR) protein